MGKYVIQSRQENCTGCLRCQLACSDLYEKAFNPSRSRIRVLFSSSGDCRIHFSEACSQCGTCVDHCFYGAIQKSRKEGER